MRLSKGILTVVASGICGIAILANAANATSNVSFPRPKSYVATLRPGNLDFFTYPDKSSYFMATTNSVVICGRSNSKLTNKAWTYRLFDTKSNAIGDAPYYAVDGKAQPCKTFSVTKGHHYQVSVEGYNWMCKHWWDYSGGSSGCARTINSSWQGFALDVQMSVLY